jgi:hypothetical protein
MRDITRGFWATISVLSFVIGAVVVLGGATLGGFVAWFVLNGTGAEPWMCVAGTAAASLVSGFVAWLLMNVFSILNA